MKIKSPVKLCALIAAMTLMSVFAFSFINPGPMSICASGEPIGPPVPPPLPPPLPPIELPQFDDQSELPSVDNQPSGPSFADPPPVDISSDPMYIDLVVMNIKCDVQNVYVRVKNTGNTVASYFEVDLYINPESIPTVGQEGDSLGLSVDGLESGVTYDCVFTHSCVGYLVYFAVVDSADDVEESNENNNVFGPVFDIIYIPDPPQIIPPAPPEFPHPPYITPPDDSISRPAPDLIIHSISIVNDCILVEVRNQGDQDVNMQFCLDVFINPTEPPDYGDFSPMFEAAAGLGTDEVITFRFAYHFDLRIDTIYGIVDSCQDVRESNENNNIFCQYFGDSINNHDDDFSNPSIGIAIGNSGIEDFNECEKPIWVPIPIPPPPGLPIDD